MSMQANFADIHLWGMRDRSVSRGMELAWEIQLSDWSTARNLSNWSSRVQITGDVVLILGVICTCKYSTKCSWIIIMFMTVHVYDALKHK